jgi:hypothetical protein
MPDSQVGALPAAYHFGRLLARCYELGLLEGQMPQAILGSAIAAPRAPVKTPNGIT